MSDTHLLLEAGWGLTSAYEGKKGQWCASRICVRPRVEGEPEQSTVLVELARLKYPDGWRESQKPFWIDKDLENETLENISLMTKQEELERSTPGRKSELHIPFPAGSKEYHREYRKRNRAKWNEYQRDYQKRARAALRAQSGKGEAEQEEAYVEDEATARLRKLVEEAEAKVRGEQNAE